MKEIEMNRNILERPFEAALIKSRRGAFGKNLSYVEGADYIRRLNDAFDGEWSFEILEHHVHGNEVVLLAASSRLIADLHPSSREPVPSPDDVMMTIRLKEAGELVGIPVVDHIVLGRGCYISMVERGLV
jgi:DNA repair protein RadC